jgi:predicted secreted hydrolase
MKLAPLLLWVLASIAGCGGASTSAPSRADEDSQHTPAAMSPLDVLRGGPGASDEGFARAVAIRPFEFPQDHGPHPQYRDEWWYVTGHLSTPHGVPFGFQLTFFRIGLLPPAAASARVAQSHWRTGQIYVAHFAITDIERGQFHSTQRFARDALGLAGAQAAPFRVWLGGWSLGDAGAPGAWTLRAQDDAYALRLTLRPLDPPVLNGDQGLSVKSDAPGSASYYYSIPRLEARGQLIRAGRTLPVNGLAWVDREWGSGSLGPHERGWDWFGLQFADGSALMFYSLRDDGGARDPHSAGTWIAPDGTVRPLASDEVRIEVEDHWKSPRGGIYPSRWRLRVSSLALDVRATPVLADQELDTTPRYWEGDVNTSGTKDGRAISGQGYVELVGYGGR